MTAVIFFNWLQSFCPVLPYSLKYGTNQQRTAQFFIGIDFFDPDPTKSKIKPQQKLQIAHFAHFLEDQLQQILADRHSMATKKSPIGH